MHFGCVFTRPIYQLNIFSRVCLQTDFYQLNLTTIFTVKFNLQSKPLTQRIQIANARHNQHQLRTKHCNDASDHSRCTFAKEKEFYSANGAHVLTNQEDVTKCFYSVNPTTKQHSPPKAQDYMWVYPRQEFWFKDLAEELEKSNRVGGIVNRKK